MKEYVIEKHVLHINRRLVQGGFSNDEYPIDYLKDYRKMHHYPSLAICKLKNFTLKLKDTKFYDAVNEETNEKAEGKNCGGSVSFVPSRDTGANRTFNEENLKKCFETNRYYFLYAVHEITDTYVTFYIYWVPIHIICEWYEKFGNGKGCISKTNWKHCLNLCEFVQTQETRD